MLLWPWPQVVGERNHVAGDLAGGSRVAGIRRRSPPRISAPEAVVPAGVGDDERELLVRRMREPPLWKPMLLANVAPSLIRSRMKAAAVENLVRRDVRRTTACCRARC